MSNYPFKLEELPYSYDALEPYISRKTLEIHHDRLLKKYTDNLNEALKDYPEFHSMSLEELLKNCSILPFSISKAVMRNAGGVFNHRFYFDGMTDKSEKKPFKMLGLAILNEYRSLENFKKEFTDCAMSVFGSGYACFCFDSQLRPVMVTTANQLTPISCNLCPILMIDVWEHSYFLDYYEKRIDYINGWFELINWRRAEEIYLSLLGA